MTSRHTFAPLAAAAQRGDAWHIRLLMVAALALAVTTAALTGAFRGTESRIEEASFSLLSRPASGQVHVVEMDAASMAAIQRWPWPRGNYAEVVRALDAAGVRSISFDVDFSSGADPEGDRAFADAIANARATVMLPTFSQSTGFGEARQLDTLPIPILRDAAHLASVSVRHDPDGYVRRMPFGTITGDTARPSLAVLAAGRAGMADATFPVDFAIDPATLPRHSFIAVARGTQPLDGLAGKDVIIGSTAVELGDRYLVPRNGVIPGVIIQALAAETLLSGVPTYGVWPLPLLLAAVLAYGVLGARQRHAALVRAGGALLVLLAAWLGARVLFHMWFALVPAMLLVSAAGAIRYVTLTQRLAALGRQIDPESGLPNRIALYARAGAEGERFLVAAQIDDFDALKLAVAADDFGTLLRRIAERLQVAGGGNTVYRIEDRTLLWVSALPIDELEAQLAGIRALMRSPFEIAGRRLGVSLTFGAAEVKGAGAVVNAVHAASQARRAGKFWRLHTIGEGETASQQFSLLGELEEALRSGNIMVLYQPKLNLATRQIDAVEALVRWNHPERGLLPPDCFIPVIEEAGRIDDLTIAVLSRALEDMRGWCDRGLTIGVAVNISAALLTSENFANRALAAVVRAGAPAQRITFEVTETAQFEDTDVAIATLERFRAAGIRISMDDYGTGQSALNYLKLLPLSELKIDRMFVAQAHVDKGDALLVGSTVQLAHELGLKVVAEGIEEAACLAFLETIGCDYAQGYFVGRPLQADDLAALAAGEASTPRPAAAA
ncbi:putative bifunctional diguanylate cyclase/phosphodiesterase [Erythrobacter sp. BLCC-B19]|uniref:putative bifunctional diguanylate cyclase/phosphodiesterase n=1 Tax=Erythrobacter sp. BLCC-B19 TaxID=3025315 RepID=UPI00235ED113|nr:EAL domain-containing protein [Erythrobacter sp. BLCC-B19]WDA41885.1 EAL domain-containing protein [Erythrobacter sp. BLCC-B19]